MKKMKIFLFFVLIIAFLMYYQKDPVITVVIVVIFLALYLFFKARKGRRKEGRGGFFKGSNSLRDNRVDDLVTLVVAQQLINSTSSKEYNDFYQDEPDDREEQIERTKRQILELLEN